MKRIVLIMTLLSSFILQGCGFHLKGQYQYADAIQPIYINAQNKEFKQELNKVFKFGQLEVAESAESASAIIEFLNEEHIRTPLTLDDRGLATSYRVSYNIIYVVINQNGEKILDETSNSSSRVLEYNSSQQLQVDKEEAKLYEEIYEDIANIVARKIANLNGLPVDQQAKTYY